MCKLCLYTQFQKSPCPKIFFIIFCPVDIEMTFLLKHKNTWVLIILSWTFRFSYFYRNRLYPAIISLPTKWIISFYITRVSTFLCYLNFEYMPMEVWNGKSLNNYYFILFLSCVVLIILGKLEEIWQNVSVNFECAYLEKFLLTCNTLSIFTNFPLN